MGLHWKSIQQKLRDFGCYLHRVDGVCGPNTIEAVTAFQKQRKLTQDGIVGANTLRELGLFDDGHPDHSIATSAELIKLSYKIKKQGITKINETLRNDFGTSVIRSCPAKGVEAYMLSNRVLLVPGSNSLWDYAKFNFRLLNIGKSRLRLKWRRDKTAKEDTKTHKDSHGLVWHQGFFTHANHVNKWIGTNRANWPRLIIGHSLGAASAQVLSTIWSAPSIGFAAPRILQSSATPEFENLSLSICRNDDIVCRYPSGFERLGRSEELIHKKRRRGLNHNMKSYIDALNNQADGLNIPTYWNP